MSANHPLKSESKSEADTVPRRVTCPRCGGDSVYAPSNASRPFCSAHCKSIDFGAWSSEAFRMAAPITSEDLDDAGNALPQ